jgi:iron-sulfur cluster repair protein YtfE (RIC family)
MFAYSIINFHELTPGSLCNVIANKFHFPIQHLADQVMTYFNLERQEDRDAPATADLQQLLFGKMQTEIAQLIRKETTVLFPVIRNRPALPQNKKNIRPAAYDSVQQSFQKILLLLQKIRQISANYQLQDHWSTAYKLCVGDIFITEQLLQQWIYVEQNILYPAAIPGHTMVITQHDINNVTID